MQLLGSQYNVIVQRRYVHVHDELRGLARWRRSIFALMTGTASSGVVFNHPNPRDKLSGDNAQRNPIF